jgi:predicted MFS family arabinose efflux permease
MTRSIKILSVFAPFAAGYLLSYLFRTINGPLADRLVGEFGWDARTLGLLTSAYFLTFSAFQLPLGALIDRYGPRRVQAALSLIAASGALLFGFGQNLAALIVARALIGLGTSGALMAGLKGLNIWVAKSRLAALNGFYVMCGGLGAMASTYPVDLLTQLIGWRGTFMVLSVATLIGALAVYAIVPEKPSAGHPEPWRVTAAGLWRVYRTASFWRLAPISAAVIGTAFAVHGLWAARWMADVDSAAPQSVTSVLLAMGAGLTIGAVTLGVLANALRARGVSQASLFAAACIMFLLIESAIVSHIGLPAWLAWPCFAVFGAMTVLSYSMLADFFTADMIGRANSALNVLHLGMAFVIQSVIGLVTNFWSPDAIGHYPKIAYQAALAVPMGLQILALCWFLLAPSLTRLGLGASIGAAAQLSDREA